MHGHLELDDGFGDDLQLNEEVEPCGLEVEDHLHVLVRVLLVLVLAVQTEEHVLDLEKSEPCTLFGELGCFVVDVHEVTQVSHDD